MFFRAKMFPVPLKFYSYPPNGQTWGVEKRLRIMYCLVYTPPPPPPPPFTPIYPLKGEKGGFWRFLALKTPLFPLFRDFSPFWHLFDKSRQRS
jgi:hypothetical protein